MFFTHDIYDLTKLEKVAHVRNKSHVSYPRYFPHSDRILEPVLDRVLKHSESKISDKYT